MVQTSLRRWVPSWCLVPFLTSPVLPATVRVPDDFPSVQAAIDAAAAGDVVVVAPMEYTVRAPVTFGGKNIVVRSAAGPDETVIRMVGPVDPKRASVVVFENGEGTGAVLEGFTLTGGSGTDWGTERFEENGGGGVLCRGASPRLLNVVIADNEGKVGGGLLCLNGASPVLTNCRISRNDARFVGGGVACRTNEALAPAVKTVPTFISCTIEDNVAEHDQYGQGGGVYCFFASPVFQDCSIVGNMSTGFGTGGGGIAIEDSSSAVLRNCMILRNAANGLDPNSGSGMGGALSCALFSTAELSDCVIGENFAYLGGGVACFWSSAVTLNQCTVRRNRAATPFGGGGVKTWGRGTVTMTGCILTGNNAQVGGALQCYQNEPPSTLSNCLITGNAAVWGGALHSNGEVVEIINCTVADNHGSQGGGGVFRYQTPVKIVNSIFWNNTKTEQTENGTELTPNDLEAYPADAPGAEPVTSLFGADPLFVRNGDFRFDRFRAVEIAGYDYAIPNFIREEGDYQLLPGSPAIDAATAELAPAWDLLGRVRPCGSSADMGAYEFLSPGCNPEVSFRRGDANASDGIDIADAIFIVSYLVAKGAAPSCLDAADTNDSDAIDIADAIAILVHIFGRDGPLPPPFGECGIDPTIDELGCESYSPCP